MKHNYDLHSHSTVSDGVLSPAALVRRALEKGVDVLALTDHDEVAGFRPAAEEAAKRGLGLLAGVEVSVSWRKQTVHIVGLDVDPDHTGLSQGLAGLREYRHWRGEEIGRRLEKAGVMGAYAGALAQCKGDLLTRTHYGRFLLEAGVVDQLQGAFKHYLLRGKPGYVPGKWASLEQAVGWINAAGGVAVVAHPARYGMTRTRLRSLFGEFLEQGGAGLEVVSSSHNSNEIHTMAQHALDLGLAASRGSDFHDPGCRWVELGRLPPLPNKCEPIWERLNIPTEQSQRS
ncbi:MAG: PHP domain-containing protein [Gammaproteobacteria bacterium]|jgi:3',5'-nucleoside bisphosphate phosphatase|nr:PHP domain-containing protein [Gammaproteobacteria bacterium]